jgi:hypothetical protein
VLVTVALAAEGTASAPIDARAAASAARLGNLFISSTSRSGRLLAAVYVWR